jgi:hypothetical protein
MGGAIAEDADARRDWLRTGCLHLTMAQLSPGAADAGGQSATR